MRMNAARQRRFVRVVALVVLLGAILPNVTYLGHWSIRALNVTAAAAGDGHANHCHGSPACADQAAYGLQWWSDMQDALSLDGGLARAEPVDGDAIPSDPLIAPPATPTTATAPQPAPTRQSTASSGGPMRKLSCPWTAA